MDQITQTLMMGMQNGTTPLEQVWQFLIKLGIHLHLTLEKTSLVIVTESGSMVTWGWSWEGGNLQGEDIEELMGLMEKSSVLIMVVVAWVYVFENSSKYTLKLLYVIP